MIRFIPNRPLVQVSDFPPTSPLPLNLPYPALSPSSYFYSLPPFPLHPTFTLCLPIIFFLLLYSLPPCRSFPPPLLSASYHSLPPTLLPSFLSSSSSFSFSSSKFYSLPPCHSLPPTFTYTRPTYHPLPSTFTLCLWCHLAHCKGLLYHPAQFKGLWCHP